MLTPASVVDHHYLCTKTTTTTSATHWPVTGCAVLCLTPNRQAAAAVADRQAEIELSEYCIRSTFTLSLEAVAKHICQGVSSCVRAVFRGRPDLRCYVIPVHPIGRGTSGRISVPETDTPGRADRRAEYQSTVAKKDSVIETLIISLTQFMSTTEASVDQPA